MAFSHLRFPGWRAALVYTHRWLGIAGCLTFLTWFASGIVMMYARMPVLAPEERLARADVLDLSSLTVTPAQAAGAAAVRVGSRLSVVMAEGRPAYRFADSGTRSGATIVFGDTGELFAGADLESARRAARRYVSDSKTRLRDDGVLVDPDQWTLQARAQLPAYRFAVDDAAGTQVYVSRRSGEVILRTTARERFWGYLGPVLHWLYFTPLRRNGGLWSDVVIWTSLAGCVVCLSGLIWGLLRISPTRRFRIAGTQQASPYAGAMKWHHYSGLIFGVVTLSWTFSGLLSMGPWNVLSSRDLAVIRQQLSSPITASDSASAADIRRAVARLAQDVTVKELQRVVVDGRTYWYALDAPDATEAHLWTEAALGPRRPLPRLDHRYVDAAAPEDGTFRTFDDATLRRVAEGAMHDVPIADASWQTAHDGYYYDARGQRALPVLRVRYANDARTWLYLDPAAGAVTLAHDRTTRTGRWLYQGLHSLDFPVLYDKRPLWDIVVIILSLGGLAVGASILAPAWRRLRDRVWQAGRRAFSAMRIRPGSRITSDAPAAKAVPSTQIRE